MNIDKLYEEAETMWKNSPELAESLMKALQVAHQDQYTMLCVGEDVIYREAKSTVVGITRINGKYRDKVDEISWDEDFIVNLSNGHWSFKENIKLLNQ